MLLAFLTVACVAFWLGVFAAVAWDQIEGKILAQVVIVLIIIATATSILVTIGTGIWTLIGGRHETPTERIPSTSSAGAVAGLP